MSVHYFYAFYLHQRDTERDTFLRGCQLSLEYVCMEFVKVEHMHQLYLAANQRDVCADQY